MSFRQITTLFSCLLPDPCKTYCCLNILEGSQNADEQNRQTVKLDCCIQLLYTQWVYHSQISFTLFYQIYYHLASNVNILPQLKEGLYHIESFCIAT